MAKPTSKGNKSERARRVLLCLSVVALGCYFNLVFKLRGELSGYSISNIISSNEETAKAKPNTDPRFRKFRSHTVGHTIVSLPPRDPEEIQHFSCTRWAISTALSPPNDTFLMHKSWCLLLVDEHASRPISLHDGVASRVILLSEQVEEWTRTLLRSQSVTLPFQGRHHQKHLGYLYAISQGAKFIVDLPHAQSLQLLQDLQELIPYKSGMKNVRYVIDNEDDFIPYPYFYNQKNATELELKIPYSQSMKIGKVGMIKVLAQEEEEEEQGPLALRSTQAPELGYPVLVPQSGLCACPTETTMYTFNSFWALLLPSTIPEDSRELWITHVTYAFFREMDLRVVVTRPLKRKTKKHVDQSIDDTQTEVFRFLRDWSNSLDNTPARIEQLWIDLYEYGFIEYGDVISMQDWLYMLSLSDYQFPKMNLQRFPNVALMGQFNFPETPQKYMFWHQNWRSVFDKIIIRGPFDNNNNKTQHLETIRSYGIEAYNGRDDAGYVSPIENLMRTLYQFENSSSIDGVVYIHDDAILNMKQISPGFEKDEIVVNRMWWPTKVRDYSFLDPREAEDKVEISTLSFKVFENGTIVTLDDRVYNLSNKTEQKPFYDSLRRWCWWKQDNCVPAFVQLAGDPAMDPYREPDGSILVSPYVQADFMYVPTKYAQEFGDVAKLFLKYDMFIECAVGTIIDILRRSANVSVRRVSLCSNWSKRRGTPAMAHDCNFDRGTMRSAPFGVYHPIKTGLVGFQAWTDFFDVATRGKRY